MKKYFSNYGGTSELDNKSFLERLFFDEQDKNYQLKKIGKGNRTYYIKETFDSHEKLASRLHTKKRKAVTFLTNLITFNVANYIYTVNV